MSSLLGTTPAVSPSESRFASITPLLEWNDCAGCVSATYNAPLKKYLMFITDRFPIIFRMNTYMLESDRITGPRKLVTFMERFGEQAYFVSLPSKFISPNGRLAWLASSANFANNSIHANLKSDPPGGGYGLMLQEISLLA
jgi:hypothetical protein